MCQIADAFPFLLGEIFNKRMILKFFIQNILLEITIV